jgi:hypothetical protein
MLNILKKNSKFELMLDRDIQFYNHVLNSDKSISPKARVFWKVQRRLSLEPKIESIEDLKSNCSQY